MTDLLENREAFTKLGLYRMFDLSSALFAVFDASGSVVFVNAAWESLLGRSVQELMSHPYDFYVHPQDRPKTAEAMATVLTGTEVVGFRNRAECASGAYRHIEWQALAADGMVYACATDVTQAVTAETQRQATNALHNHLFELTEQGVVYQDGNGTIVAANNAAEKMLGVASSGDRTSGKTWEAVDVNGDPFPTSLYPAKLAMRTRRAVTDVQMGVVNPNTGARRWLRVSATPMFGPDSASEPNMVMVTLDDVSDARRDHTSLEQRANDLELALREQNVSSGELKEFVGAVNQHAIVSMTDREGRIVSFNEAFLRRSEYSAEELLGKTHRVVNSGFHPPGFFKTLWETILSGHTWQGEVLNRSKSGQLRWALSTVTPLRGPDGNIDRFVAVRTDITKQKMAELAAETAAATKSRFLAHISHEIRTPLTAIVGLSHLLDSGSADIDVAEATAQIRSASDHLLSVVNDVLDFSKIEAGHTELELAPLNVSELVSSVVDLFAPVTEDGLMLTADVSPTVPEEVSADATRLRQVLMNLVSNAVKATGRGTVGLSVAANRSRPGRVALTFEVVDDGPGLSPDDAANIFRPFSQTATQKTLSGGTGLGLPISSHLVNLMGGSLEVESAPGQGAAFFFTIDVAVEVPDLSAEIPDEPVDLTGVRVLVVDDSDVIRKIGQWMLVEFGATVVQAEDGTQTLAWARERPDCPLDLILMDVHMPGIDGRETATVLRTIPGYDRVPIVALTADALTGARAECVEAGMNDHLAKPFSPEALNAMVARWTKREPANA